ncbi:HEAT repeat domain-containing protein [Pseudomonas leptonychotis]|uniref:PBS lyase n=1 Tax=Pseudomonas leptonychotis TaxID=2448482 RepID=A0A4T1ZTY5_9PSED|nr:HEAT repeat domain-containing protein [Pseudomonas leptonychotis]TIH07032.1 PBS lyase [Pseudomonas leptonychotis]
MKHLKEWLERLRRQPQHPLSSTHYWQQDALNVLADCDEQSDWLQLSRNSNGFVREVAVRVLCDTPSPQALLALVERLNDWVAQVRQLAERGVQQYLHPNQADALLYALEPLLALAGKGRCNPDAILQQMAEVLSRPELHAALIEALNGRRGKGARFLFELLLKSEAGALPTTLQIAMKHADTDVRRMALTASRRLPQAEARVLLRLGFASPSAQIRVTALREWLAQDEQLPQIQNLLRLGLLDPAPAVRCLACWAAPRYQINSSDVLMLGLAEQPTDKNGWLGLIGLAKDLVETRALPTLQIALLHTAPVVRSRALEAIAAIAPDDVLATLLSALDNPSTQVVRAASRLLKRQPIRTGDEQLSAAIVSSLRQGESRKLVTLAALTPLWIHLQHLLQALEIAEDEGQREGLLAALNIWHKRRRRAYALRATAEQQALLSTHLLTLMAAGKLEHCDPQYWIN